MQKSALGILGLLLLAGCTDSAKQVEVTSKSSTAKATWDASSVDAAILLASTLEEAKATDKRVMVRRAFAQEKR